MTETEVRPELPFESNKILDSAMRLMWRHRALCLGLALGPAVICAILSYFVGLFPPYSIPPAAEPLSLPLLRFALLFTTFLMPLVLQAVFVDIHHADRKGEPPTLFSCLSIATLESFLPIPIAILFALLITFLSFLGILLLFVATSPLIAALSLAIPAGRMERGEDTSSIRRSASLTRGHRWQVFNLVFGLILWTGVFASATFVATTPIVFIRFAMPAAAPIAVLALAVAEVLALTAIWSLWGAAHALAYFELRQRSEAAQLPPCDEQVPAQSPETAGNNRIQPAQPPKP